MEQLPSEKIRILSVRDWAITIFITSLPLIGFIMLLIWAFDGNTNIHKQNYAKGSLLIMLIAICIALVFLFLFGGIAIMAHLFD
jgi:uncharacterized membrane protein YqjE